MSDEEQYDKDEKAYFLFKLENYEEAAEIWRKLLLFFPDDFHLNYCYGLALYYSSGEAAAIPPWKKAARLEPITYKESTCDALYCIGCFLYRNALDTKKLNDLAVALEALEKANKVLIPNLERIEFSTKVKRYYKFSRFFNTGHLW